MCFFEGNGINTFKSLVTEFKTVKFSDPYLFINTPRVGECLLFTCLMSMTVFSILHNVSDLIAEAKGQIIQYYVHTYVSIENGVYTQKYIARNSTSCKIRR